MLRNTGSLDPRSSGSGSRSGLRFLAGSGFNQIRIRTLVGNTAHYNWHTYWVEVSPELSRLSELGTAAYAPRPPYNPPCRVGRVNSPVIRICAFSSIRILALKTRIRMTFLLFYLKSTNRNWYQSLK